MKRTTILIASSIGLLALFAILFRLLRKAHTKTTSEPEPRESDTYII